ncbi:MAG: SHOCT domain-containing protein [Deltaproteobacteria bacterium]|nr:SHOCT domain-containing protein [Deltaproteobacteria bacterium]
MKKIRKNRTGNMTRVVLVLVAITIGFPMVPGFMTTARAGSGGAFVGGMVAGHIIGGFVRRDRVRTAAEVDQSYSQQRMVQQAAPAPAPAAPQNKEQKLQELDKLAAGGYITPAEYKARKNAILDSN